MTILPKKKQSKEKSDNDSSDRSNSPPSSEGGRSSLMRVRTASPAPQRWTSPPPLDLERSNHEPLRFDEGCSSHNAGANKRRLRDRSSPHRNVRKQRHEANLRMQNQPSNQQQRPQNIRVPQPSQQQQQQQQQPSGETRHHSEYNSEEERKNGGFNSEDECHQPQDTSLIEKDKEFEMMLKEKKGLVIKKMGEDGACLFRAVADQVYGDQEMHSVVRFNCVDYMAKNKDFFKQFVTEDFNDYLNRKKLDSCHGNHVEMQALCELYNRPIEVYQLSLDPINTFHASYETDNEPIRLSYHRNVHYNSVIDPYKATIGVGLGLPGYQPGLADKNLVRDAVRQSEETQIEQTMLEDKLRETDWELTQETIEEQVARESYLQWVKEQERSTRGSPRSGTSSSFADHSQSQMWWNKTSASSSTSITSTTTLSTATPEVSSTASSSSTSSSSTSSKKSPSPQTPKPPFVKDSPASSSTVSRENYKPSNQNDFSPHLFGLSEWEDEDAVLARVMAESQNHYFNQLKMAAQSNNPSKNDTKKSNSNNVTKVTSKHQKKKEKEEKGESERERQRGRDGEEREEQEEG